MKALKTTALEGAIRGLAVSFAMAIVDAFRGAEIGEVADVVDRRALARMGRRRGQLTPRQELMLLELDDIPVPSNGVRTSNEAAKMMERDSSRLRRLVFRVIQRNGGMTCQEVEDLTGISHETISARIWELHTRGWLRDSGKVRLTRAKYKAIVWVVPTESRKSKRQGKRKGET